MVFMEASVKRCGWGRGCSFLLLWITFLVACGPAKKGLFADKRSEHTKYGDRIKEAGLDKTAMGSTWFVAAGKSLAEPLAVTLPYRETGYFADDKPSAAGYAFDVRRGDRLLVNVIVVPSTVYSVFTELFQAGEKPEKAKMLAEADSTMRIEYEIEKDGRYILRLQPQLLESVEFTITVNTAPALAFPVSEAGNPKMISFWSDPRDGGTRDHEGVDISAKFRTPAVAGADGSVYRVMENRLGGKVVFMRPRDRKYTLYYAHLDSQIVRTGDEVKAGQVLGLVGTTGNAKGTVPHLHFGIYTVGGAVDPLPFIDPRRKEPAKIEASVKHLNKWIRTTASTKLVASPDAKSEAAVVLERGSAIRIAGATAAWYRAMLPDGRQGYVSSRSTSDNTLSSKTLDTLQRLLNRPLATAPAITRLEKNTKVDVIGSYDEYLLVQTGQHTGWIRKTP